VKRDRVKTELLALGIAAGRWPAMIGGGHEAVKTIGRALDRILYLEERVATLEGQASKASPPRRKKR